ncbi:unnamed protein product [Cyclocybe aegerita]|uniref:F-box domain-containing protein n=1 Tax=Cyclocybe aegerita TaxID=1973307 RepID=A0A8S0WT10_CYCAE|nr:unnamed protein product [Cyclocybe aegerita]
MLSQKINQDIFLEVLSYISTQEEVFPPNNAINKSTSNILLSLALTCRAFLEPSLDKLWVRLDDLHPLFRLLPTFQPGIDGVWFLESPILDLHWETLQEYAKRIQTLVYLDEGAPIDPSVFFAVSQYADRKANQRLLPSLRQLFTIMPFTDNHGTYRSMWSFVDALAEQAPGMHSAFLHFALPSKSFNAVAKMRNLTQLTIMQNGSTPSQVNAASFVVLSSMKALTHLRLDGLVLSDHLMPLTNPRAVSFSALKTPEISASMPEIVPLFQAAKLPALQVLKIKLVPPILEEPHQDWWGFCRELKLSTKSQLPELVIKPGHFPFDFRPHLEGLPMVIPDILAFNFIKLDLQEYKLFRSFSDDDIRDFARAWPNIEELHLPTQIPSKLTFTAFVDIAKQMRNLKQLTLNFILRKDDSLSLESVNTTGSGFQHPLHHLNGLNSTFVADNTDALTLGACLHALFPNLTLWT